MNIEHEKILLKMRTLNQSISEYPNDYVGYLKTKDNNEKYIDFSVKEE